MDISRLVPTHSLIAALRRDAVGKADRPEGASPASRTDKPAASTAAGRMAQLRQQLVGLAADVDLTDAVAVRQTRSRFVRSILLWEFGPDLRGHPQWRTLLEGVEHALDCADERDNAAFIELLSSLKPKRR